MDDGEKGIGRYVMTCCENDIQFVGFVCKGVTIAEADHMLWVDLTAKVNLEFSTLYGRIGPVFTFMNGEVCEPPEQRVATFY